MCDFEKDGELCQVRLQRSHIDSPLLGEEEKVHVASVEIAIGSSKCNQKHV